MRRLLLFLLLSLPLMAADNIVIVGGSAVQKAAQNVPATLKATDNGDGTHTLNVSSSGGSVPTGGSTSAKQDTGNTSLASIDGKLPASLGAKTGAASFSIVPASDATLPVTGTFWQATQPVSLSTVAVTNAGTFATQASITTLGTAVPASAVPVIQATATTVLSTALEASHVGKASAGTLVSLHVFNSKASAQYILVMNSATVPGDGAVTLLYPPIYVPATSNVSLNFTTPLTASTGISVSNSSTGTFTKTIGSADCVFAIQVQ